MQVEGQARVLVLGKNIKEKLFGNSPAVGESVKVRNVNFRVLGVLEERGYILEWIWMMW